MHAYVVAAEPIHENSGNYFLAELGFYRLGYFVERYDLPDLANADLSGETPVFGGIESLHLVLPNYTGLPYYPLELSDFMFRTAGMRPIEEVRSGEFFKPVAGEHKLFSPRVRDESFDCDLLISKIPDGTQVIVTGAVDFVSEFRVYVCGGEVLNVCFYKGDPLTRPDPTAIKDMVKSCAHYSSAFGLDVGVIDSGATALVEMNDFCCLGNYGLRARDYARCIAIRWEEVWNWFHPTASKSGSGV